VIRTISIAAAALVLAACHEIPQDAAKPYAGKEDTKAYAGDMFKGDKAKYEAALADRAKFQNDYSPYRSAGLNAQAAAPAAAPAKQ
jgi:hypothetical protein